MNLNQIVVVGGCTESYHDVLALTNTFNVEYGHIVEAFNSGQCMMVLFKNILTTQTQDQYSVTRSHTIITIVTDHSVHMQLQVVHERMCNKTH